MLGSPSCSSCPPLFFPFQPAALRRRSFAGLSLVLLALPGCKHRHGSGSDYVYVVPKTSYLRDRVAAVSNRVADIQNGEKLLVLEHDRRFYKVRTPDGKVGWLEEHSVMDQDTYDKFLQLDSDHAKDPVVAKAVLRDELYVHLTPGRKTEHMFLLPENDHLELLVRASVPKPLPPQALLAPAKPTRPKHPVPGMVPHPKKVEKRPPSGSTIWAPSPPHPEPATAPDLLAMEDDPTPLEDWWLARDQNGKVGWVLARRLDVEIPDQVAQYSEGKRIVGAYLLNTVYDPGGPSESDESGEAGARARKKKGVTAPAKKHKVPVATGGGPGPGNTDEGGPDAAKQPVAPQTPANTPRNVPQYVTVTSEYTDGLPFDWDQVRVFIWNVHKHRYETAYRLREQQGYLPVVIGQAEFKDANGRSMGMEPTFTIRTSPDGVVTRDAAGVVHPEHVQETTYRLEGGIVRSAVPPPPREKKPEQEHAAAAGPARHPVAVMRGHRRRR